MQRNEPLVFECSGWEVNLAKRELRAAGVTVPLGSRAFEIVETLVRSAGELVTKDDLMARVWPDLVVGENTVQVHISAIRKAFGPDRKLLKTVSGRGYRLLGDWAARQEPEGQSAEPPERLSVTAQAYFTNVPIAASALIGRETAVQALLDLISAYRVVTLTGPGGIGKTVLASEVARRLSPTAQSDVLFIELVSLADPALVPSMIAYVLNLQLSGDQISAEAVARALGSRRIFLILDNCEHVIDSAAEMTETLLRLCPQVSILATSREVLRVEGEFVYRVPGLEVPADDLDAPVEVLEHSAVQLFVARTRSRQAEFTPQHENLPVIAAVCRHLDGIPLAIEFAAARAATLGIQQVANHLDDRFSLLSSGRRTALPRHQTLRATLDWSYELLPEEEQRLLRYLGIFPAGFTLEAVTAVGGGTEASVALGISNLVSKSLVSVDGFEEVHRWRLLETVRVYALEKLIEKGEYDEIVRRHARFYLAFFLPFSIEDDLQSAIDHLAAYRREIDNLRAALNWAFSPKGDAGLGVELAVAAADFWPAVSLIGEACEWAVKALASIDGAAGTRREMILRCSLGFGLVYTQGMTPPAREALMRALDLARQLSEIGFQQRALCGLWLFSSRSMALKDALGFARDLEDVGTAHDEQSRALASWLIGIPLTYMAEHVEAGTRLQWAVDHYPAGRRFRDSIRVGGDVQTSASSHNTVNLLSRGLLDEASRTATRAIKEARETSQPTVLCVALAWAAGFTFLSLDDLERANTHGEELVAHAYKHGLRPFHDAGLCVRGSIAVKRGNAEAGMHALNTGLAGMRDTAYLLFYPFFRTRLAMALGSVGRVHDGLREIDQTLQFAEQMEYRWYVPEILRNKGELLLRHEPSDPGMAAALFQRSMQQAQAQQALYWELLAATSLARLLQHQNRHAEAVAMLSSVYERLPEGFAVPNVVDAKALLEKLTGSQS